MKRRLKRPRLKILKLKSLASRAAKTKTETNTKTDTDTDTDTINMSIKPSKEDKISSFSFLSVCNTSCKNLI